MSSVIDKVSSKSRLPLSRRLDTYFIELLLVIGILGILNSIALHEYAPLVTRTKFLSVVSVIQDLKYESILHYAQTGRWASSDDLANVNTSGVRDFKIKRVQVSHGSFNLVLEPRFDGQSTETANVEWNLTLRRNAASDVQTDLVLWNCGYAQHPRFVDSGLPNLTTIPREFLTYTCRN